MKKNIFIFLALIVLIVGYLLYKQLGGNPEIKFEVTEAEFILYGKEYSGNYNNSKVEELFLLARDLSDSLNVSLAVVNYGSDENGKEIHQFIGITGETLDSPPNSYLKKEFQPPSAIKTAINAHNAVMPKPEKVREMAAEFGARKGISLSETTIEIYKSERELEVYFLSNKKR